MMKPKANTAKTAKRLLSYIISWYKATFAAVLFCIFVSAGATVASSLFLKTLVDGYILSAALWTFRCVGHGVGQENSPPEKPNK